MNDINRYLEVDDEANSPQAVEDDLGGIEQNEARIGIIARFKDFLYSLYQGENRIQGKKVSLFPQVHEVKEIGYYEVDREKKYAEERKKRARKDSFF